MKGLILAAGMGTRFHPITKYIPKEMLPMGNHPVLGQIIEEAWNSGVTELIVVTHPKKKSIINYVKDHWDGDIKLVYQRDRQYGVTGAIWAARKYIQYFPFCVFLGDTLVWDDDNGMKKLIELHNRFPCKPIGVSKVNKEEASVYGIADCHKEEDFYMVDSIIEKPMNPKSNLALNGRYILDWRHARFMSRNPEIHLTYILNHINIKHNPVVAVESKNFFDIGTPNRYYKALDYYMKERD